MLVPNDWIEKHRHDLDGWHPTIEIVRPGGKQTITIKSQEAEDAAIKAMKGGKRK